MNHRLPFVFVLLLSLTATAFSQITPEDVKKQAKLDRQRSADQMYVNQLMRIARDRGFQKEIQLDETQSQTLRESVEAFQVKLQKFNEEYREDQQEIMKMARSGEYVLARELANEFHSKQSELMKKMVDAAEAILLPHQRDRLKQISKQQLARHHNPFRDEFGVALGLADELELTDKERRILTKTIEKVRSQYYEDLAKLKGDAKTEILQALPAGKRERVKEILGEHYDHEDRSRIAANEHRKRLEEQRRAIEQQRAAAEKRAKSETD